MNAGSLRRIINNAVDKVRADGNHNRYTCTRCELEIRNSGIPIGDRDGIIIDRVCLECAQKEINTRMNYHRIYNDMQHRDRVTVYPAGGTNHDAQDIVVTKPVYAALEELMRVGFWDKRWLYVPAKVELTKLFAAAG